MAIFGQVVLEVVQEFLIIGKREKPGWVNTMENNSVVRINTLDVHIVAQMDFKKKKKKVDTWYPVLGF